MMRQKSQRYFTGYFAGREKIGEDLVRKRNFISRKSKKRKSLFMGFLIFYAVKVLRAPLILCHKNETEVKNQR